MHLHTQKVQQNKCSKTKHINMRVLDQYVCFKADTIILINKMCSPHVKLLTFYHIKLTPHVKLLTFHHIKLTPHVKLLTFHHIKLTPHVKLLTFHHILCQISNECLIFGFSFSEKEGKIKY
jgi:hypothetical protein